MIKAVPVQKTEGLTVHNMGLLITTARRVVLTRHTVHWECCCFGAMSSIGPSARYPGVDAPRIADDGT